MYICIKYDMENQAALPWFYATLIVTLKQLTSNHFSDYFNQLYALGCK